QGGFLGFRRRLAGEGQVFTLALQGGSNHAFVIAALVDARGIEIGDPDVGGAFDHARVGGNHASESDRGYLQSGFAEDAVAESRRGDRGAAGIGGSRAGDRLTCGRSGGGNGYSR